MSKRQVEDALTLAYSQQADGNPLKPSMVTLASELLRMRDRERVLVEAMEAIIKADGIREDVSGIKPRLAKIARAALEAVKE